MLRTWSIELTVLILLVGTIFPLPTTPEAHNDSTAVVCSLTFLPESGKHIPIPFMPNEKIIIRLEVMRAGMRLKDGSAKITITDSNNSTRSSMDAVLHGEYFIAHYTLPNNAVAGLWNVTATWRNRSAVSTCFAHFAVHVPVLNATLKYQNTKKSMRFSGALSTEHGPGTINIFVLDPLSRNSSFLSGTQSRNGLELNWSSNFSTLLAPSDMLGLELNVRNTGPETKELKIYYGLTGSVRITEASSVHEFPRIPLVSHSATLVLQPNTAKNRSLDFAIPALHRLGAGGALPFRYGIATLNISFYSGEQFLLAVEQTVIIVPHNFVCSRLLYFKSQSLRNLNFTEELALYHFGELRNFSFLALVSFEAGTYALWWKNGSLQSPIPKLTSSPETNGTLRLTIAPGTENRIETVQLFYSSNGTSWINIANLTDGLTYIWNTTALAPGKYYIKAIVVDEFGFEGTNVTVVVLSAINRISEEYMTILLFVVSGITLFVIAVMVFLRYWRRAVQKRAADSYVMMMKSLLSDLNYRYVIRKVFEDFTAYNRSVFGLTYPETWTLRDYKRLLRRHKLLRPEIGKMLDTYYEQRFSLHPMTRKHAVFVTNTFLNYRRRFIKAS